MASTHGPGEDRRHRCRSGRSAAPRPATARTSRACAPKHDAHGGQVVAVLGHVERRHRHDQDHHELADDERDEGRRDARAAQDLPDRADAGAGSSPVARREASSASSYGSGRSRAKIRIAARPTNTIGTRYGPASSGRPDLDREVARDRDQRRPDHRADGRAPDHDADRGRPPVGRDHVAGRVARELVRAVAEADQQRAGQQQRERAATARPRWRSARPARRGRSRSARPARRPAPGHEARQQHGPDRGAEHDGRRPAAPASACDRRASAARRSSRR